MTGFITVTKAGGCAGKPATKSPIISYEQQQQRRQKEEEQLSLLALLITAIRKSLGHCHVDRNGDGDGDEEFMNVVHQIEMEIGCPTDVQHITHVTFDRFHGLLGLPLEFQSDIPVKVPSASASVFGVSAESMQCSYDPKGNSVPIILLLLQERLYSQSGLKAEGIFRINPENSQEEEMSDPLTALMHAVQVMNLLKTLITKTLRERDEALTGDYSPMSSRSSRQETDEEYDSQQENMETDCDEITDYTHNRNSSEHENEEPKISYADSKTWSYRSSASTNSVESMPNFVGENQFLKSISFSERLDIGKVQKLNQSIETASSSLPLVVST